MRRFLKPGGVLTAAFMAGLALFANVPAATAQESGTMTDYETLLALFEDWRDFETPEMTDGAPDYSDAAMAEKQAGLETYRARLEAIDPNGWPVPRQVDYQIVRAEMNGLDFNIRVLRPWARDPAFYKSVWTYESDTPGHEGPTHHAVTELWTYDFPLTAAEEARLTKDLSVIPPLNEQARENLDGNARDLWTAGIFTIEEQAGVLEDLAKRTEDAGPELRAAVDEALTSTRAFAEWLEAEADSKTGPSGVGKENYTWYLQNVHLIPMTWEDEVMLMKRELKRAITSLKLEEHRNRDLPPLEPVSSAEEYEALAKDRVRKYMAFMEDGEIVHVKDYMEPALMEKTGVYAPPETRNFFAQATHREPMTLWTHFYHWWDLARIKQHPTQSPVRQGALLYNIFDSRAEGVATAVEEMFMHAGLYDDNPRAREIVWIMQAARAARGLASLYAQANEFTMQEASDFHVEWTPRNWMRRDLDLLGSEQQLYLRQPGYGTSYITGKHLVEELMADYAMQEGEDFVLADFLEDMDGRGVIPVSLLRWEMTGEGDQIEKLTAN
ncbi:MAG: DUF885 family protein [Euryhalocaulis sp.]|uniref:DUF885 family protein n=1 Tax=Euryhalocaulis sp. TaxID=2744307 RepID=UPI0017E6281A|nr:DUF885 family protein [Euryhalocaulis sp.]MBA4800843.1 DUF885 family protein [Euryhalocaulis sp.]